MRKVSFAEGEFYHVYNRGVDKRKVFLDREDFERFLQSMKEFNTPDPIGSIYENNFLKKSQLGGSTSKRGSLVNFIAYCINPNHYHFILQQTAKNGIEKFMQRLGTGYTMYFNNKYQRSGALFQGRFKAIHIDSNEYLLHLSTYVNLNNRVHQLGGSASKLVYKSSWEEYIKRQGGLCAKKLILDQFKNIFEYKDFAESSLKDILRRKELGKEMESLLLE